MAEFKLLPDDVICNIIARLPAKPLLRFRCVSRYWNRMLVEPNFMKMRSRKTIILPCDNTFLLIDDEMNVPTGQDTSNSVVKRGYPLDNRCRRLKLIGTINGIVLFAMTDVIILYNPFTGESKKLPYPPSSYHRDAYGFGYGASPDDLKIVRFRQHYDTCDVYSFKDSSWSSYNMSKYNMFIKFEHDTGHFLSGFLYWVAYNRSVVIAVNVKDIVLSEISLPFKTRTGCYMNPLGTVNGCLCLLHPATNDVGFEMWVMNDQEHNQWSKTCSFELPPNEIPDPYGISHFAICFLDGKRILLWNRNNFIIYDTSKHSYKTFNISIKSLDLFEVHALEYVESLFSPSELWVHQEERMEGYIGLKETEPDLVYQEYYSQETNRSIYM